MPTVYSKFLELSSGRAKTVDLSTAGNQLTVAAFQSNGNAIINGQTAISPGVDEYILGLTQFSASPSTTSAYLNMYNSVSSVVATIDYLGNFFPASGVVSRVGHGFRNDVTTGMYLINAGNLGFATGGTAQANISSTGLFTIQSAAITATAGSGFISFVDQTATPTTPLNGYVQYADVSGRISFLNTNGYVAGFSTSALTASQVYTLPNATDTLAGISATQTLTNKTLVSPAINGNYTLNGSSSGTITVQTQAAAGTYTFNMPTTAGSPGQVLTSAGGSTSVMTWTSPFVNPSAKNYLMPYAASTGSGAINPGNGNIETGTISGWGLGIIGTLTNGLPTGTPTFGSGQAGALSLAVESSAPLAGAYSLSYSSTVATTQGNMVASGAFYIDAEDQGKVLTVKFYYNLNSGAANCNFSGTSSNSFAWAIYDVANSTWLGTAGQFGMIQNSGTGYVTGTFQTATNTTQLRLCVYNANATTGSMILYLDDFSIGPQTAPLGPAMTDWVQYTPTITGFGTPTSVAFYSRRVGDSLEVQGLFASGTSTATQAQITLGFNGTNANVTTAASKTSGGIVGHANVNTASTTYFSVDVICAQSIDYVTLGLQSSTASAAVAANGSTLASNTQQVAMFFSVPITGWSSNTQMSNDTDTRVVALKAHSTTGASMGTLTNAFTAVVYNTVDNDTHGAYNSSTGVYTIPVTGFYDFAAQVYTTGTQALNSAVAVDLYNVTTATELVQSVVYAGGAVTSQVTPFTAKSIYLTAGTQVEIRALYVTSTVSYATSTSVNYLSISRQSGPAVIAATESVNANYSASGSQSIPNNADTTITILTAKVYDSHNAFNGATGVYTAPVSGKYRATLQVSSNSTVTATGVNNSFQAIMSQAGSGSTQYISVLQSPTTSAYNYQVQTTGSFSCAAGDTITFKTYTALTGAAVSISAAALPTYMCIERVGN
jgi:hypothetical protein